MAILFDLDGTLLDTAPDFAHAVYQLQAKAHLGPTPLAKLRPAISEGTSGLIHAAFGYEPTHPQNAVLAKQLLEIYQENISRYTVPFPGILSLLNHLEKNQTPWGVVTNKYSDLTHKILTDLKLFDRAACVVSGDTTPFPKPHPAPLLHACKILDIEPKRCVYIGDAKRDIDAGKAAGMTTITALFGYIPDLESARAWGADYNAHQVDEILPWIETWKEHTK